MIFHFTFTSFIHLDYGKIYWTEIKDCSSFWRTHFRRRQSFVPQELPPGTAWQQPSPQAVGVCCHVGNMFEKAAKADGITGEVLLQNLESRLDNVVFRMGIAPTRAAARQLVGHKHITVDGQVVNIPSFAVKPGMVVAVREKSKSLEVIEAALAGFNHSKYPWIEWDDQTKSGKFLHKPERADIPENIKEQLIVELYSKN